MRVRSLIHNMKYFYISILLFFLALPMAAQEGEVDMTWYRSGNKEFVLTTEAQMKGLSELVAGGNDFLGKTVYIHKDIDVSNSIWTPIGSSEAPFAGTFDGSGYRVCLGRIAPAEYGGLFGFVNGNVKNLNVSVKDAQDSLTNAGVIAGFVGKTASVKFCSTFGLFQLKNASVVGGLVGITEGEIESCANNCRLVNDNVKANAMGGIAGVAAGIIAKCHNTACLLATNVCGGIVGKNNEMNADLSIWNSFNIGDVQVVSKQGDGEDAIAGGVVGNAENQDMQQCYNCGRVSVYSFKSEGDIHCRSYAGGLVGIGSGKLVASYNIGDVVSRSAADVADKIESVSYVYAGGLLGCQRGTGFTSLSYCYNAGFVYAYGMGGNHTFVNYGGILGDFSSFAPSLKSCYYLDENCKSEIGHGSVNDTFYKNIGFGVREDELTSVKFIQKNKEVPGLNDEEVYSYDDDNINMGYPVCAMVHTLGIERQGDKAVLKAVSNASVASKGFFYWIGGLEDYTVDMPATQDFECTLDMPQKGEDCYVQAYVILHDGTMKKGNVLKMHIPNF